MSSGEVIADDKEIEYIMLGETEVPRYTSYPSAHHFITPFDYNILQGWLDAPNPDSGISFYVHIPFCPKLCWFCGCQTSIVSHHEPIADYVRLLLKEISLVAKHRHLHGKKARIHFGGGSPTMLNTDEMRDILQALRTQFAIVSETECAIEIDPRHLIAPKAHFYSTMGINRASIGIQEFDPKVQQAINREQPYAVVAQAFEHLRNSGIHNINIDLIYGLPYQTCDTISDTIEKALTLKPSRIALFSYAHVPWVKKHQRMIPEEALPDTADKLCIYLTAHQLLVDKGFIPIGMDHFARADDPLAVVAANRTLRRNFQGYTNDGTQTLLGFGLSAISQFPGGYAQNTSKFGQYGKDIEAGIIPVSRGWQLTDEDRVRKAVIDHLMCYLEADIADILEQFKLPENHFAHELECMKNLERNGMVEVTNGHIRIITPLRMAARVASSIFDQHLAKRPGVYSKVA